MDEKAFTEASAAELHDAAARTGYNDTDEYLASMRETKSTTHDARNMQRLGRKQQLVRNFRLVSMVFFIAVATSGWELSVFIVNQALIDGGRPSLVWSYVWNFIGFFPVILSMAEMASIAPIAGAQYHWVSEFAPLRFQKQMSYFSGWMSTLAWQAGNAQGFFLSGTLIQTLILVNNESYGFPNWQGTLLVIAGCFVVLFCNIYGTRYLAQVQTPLFTLHFALFLCLVVSVWVLAPRASASEVFLKFQNTGGWPNMPLAVFAGQLCGISGMTGMDTAAHMSEEIKDAGRTVPKAMVYAYFLNFVLSFTAVVTVCFGIRNLQAALNDPTYYPVVYVLRHTMSKGWMTAFLTGVVVIIYCGNVTYMAAVSRDLFAFARDGGVPFSNWIAKVDPVHHTPTNALWVSTFISIALSLIYIGSSTAFYALVSLALVALLQCYMFSISSILWRRLRHPETLPPRQWSLGRHGVWINACALVYVIWAFFWSFWPETTLSVDGVADFNWAVVLFVAVALGSGVWYVCKARHVYKGPVVLVEGREDAAKAQ